MDITISDNKPTMTSLEIAGLVESRHDSVKRTIERLANQAVISLPPLVEVKVQRERREETVSAYRFSDEQGKRDSIVVVAQLSPEFTARLVDRWQELEKEKAHRIPETLSEALLLAAEQAKQLEQAAPKVAHYDAVVERDGLLSATQVGQKLKLSAIMLNRALDSLGVYNQAMKRGRAFRQWFIDDGYGVMRQTSTGHSQPMFTVKGEAWVIERLISEGYDI